MNLELEGKIAIVTGASRGIGLAAAQALAREGARVFGAARTITTELKDVSADALSVDLSRPEGAEHLVSHVISRSGHIDILINNVGAGDAVALGGFLDVTDTQWRANLDVTFMSAVWMTRAALPHLLKTQGSIVNVSSINSKMPSVGPIAYTTAKTALAAFSKSVAEEFGPQGVRVNAVSPGAVRTSLWTADQRFGSMLAAAQGADHTVFLKQMPKLFQMTNGRLVEAEEVADLITYLASPRAASIYGADYVIDGGSLKAL